MRHPGRPQTRHLPPGLLRTQVHTQSGCRTRSLWLCGVPRVPGHPLCGRLLLYMVVRAPVVTPDVLGSSRVFHPWAGRSSWSSPKALFTSWSYSRSLMLQEVLLSHHTHFPVPCLVRGVKSRGVSNEPTSSSTLFCPSYLSGSGRRPFPRVRSGTPVTPRCRPKSEVLLARG